MSAQAQHVELSLAHDEPPAQDAPAEEKGAYVFARYAVQNEHYLGLWEEWSKAILFLLKKQWLRYDKRKRRHLPDTDVPPWRQQPVNPLTYAVYRSAISKLQKQRPTLEVVPPSGDTEDMESAKLGQSLLEHYHTALKLAKKHKLYIAWCLCTGTGWARPFWDATAGKVIPLTVPVEVTNPETGEVTEQECPCDENGEPYTLADGSYDFEHAPLQVREGDVALMIENSLCVRMNPEAETIEDATEMFVVRLLPKKRAARLYNIEESKIDPSLDDDLQEYHDLMSAAAVSADDVLGVGFGASQADAIGDRVLRIEYYAKPDPENGFPEGRHWIQIGKLPVTEEEPLPEGFWPPLVPLEDTPVPGQPHAIGLVPQAVPLNEQYNLLDAKILEHELMMAMGGKWIVHPSDRNMVINSDPGQKLVSKGYAQDKPPVQAEIKTLDAKIYEERAQKLELMQFITGLGDIGIGQKPEGVSSGRGFLVLQEVVDSLLTPTLLAFEEAIEEIGRRMLVLAQRHVSEERMIKVKGEQGRWMVHPFKGADLVDGLDVRVQTGSSFPWSKSARMDTVLSILEALPMLANNERGELDPAKVQRMLDTGGLQVFQSEGDPDSQEIDREHGMFEAYNPDKQVLELPSLGFWMNHPKHLERHFTFMKTSYMRIAKWHPAAQQAFLAHVMETIAAVQQVVEQVAPEPGAEGGSAGSGGSGKAGITNRSESATGRKDLKLTRGDRAAAGQTAA